MAVKIHPTGAPAVSATDDLFADSVADMCKRRIQPITSSCREDAPIDGDSLRACFREIATTGYFGMRVAQSAGGSGLPLTAGGLVTEALPAFLAVACVAQEATTFRLASSGAGAMQEKYLPQLLSGSVIAGTCISEPDVGSDSNHVKTAATPGRAGYHLHGAKLWSTNAPVADILIVVARESDTGRLTRLLVETGQPGVHIRPVHTTGLRQGHLAEVFLDVRVEPDHVLSDSGPDARSVLNTSWSLNRCSMGLASTSLLSRALETAADYSKSRRQFGRIIGSFQLIQGLLAEALVARDAARLLCYRALTLLQGGGQAVAEASSAKVFANEAAVAHIGKLQQVAGAYGITPEFPYSQWLADAAMLVFPDGTPQVQRLLIGREIIGMSAFT